MGNSVPSSYSHLFFKSLRLFLKHIDTYVHAWFNHTKSNRTHTEIVIVNGHI